MKYLAFFILFLNFNSLFSNQTFLENPFIDESIPDKAIAKQIYLDINPVDFNNWVIESGKNVWRYKIETEDAKSLIFSFEEIELKSSDEIRVISLKTNEVLGPYSKNSLPSSTNIIIGSSAIIEYKTDKIPSSSPFIIKSVGYGIKDENYFLNQTLNKIGINSVNSLESTLPCSENNSFYQSIRHYGFVNNDMKMEDFGENPIDHTVFEIDKLLRSTCIILFYDKGYINCATGTLLNSEGCDPYIITCNHCRAEMEDYNICSVRFGWFRTQHGDPNFKVADDYAKNKSIINSNYSDYCGLELVAWSNTLDYSLFRMLEKPNQDEYYSAWITSREFPEDNVLFNEGYSITSVNYYGFPFRGRLSKLKRSNWTFSNWILETELKSGWSGSTLNDSKNRVLGLVVGSERVTKFSSIYNFRSENNVIPSSFFDMDNSFAKGKLIENYDDGTAYSKNGGEVYMLEGEEASIKFDQCNPRMDCKPINIEDYFELSESSCEKDACCFTLKYIDPSDLLESGENPVKIQFSNIDDINDIIGDDIINSDGVFQKDKSLEFCIDKSAIENNSTSFLMSFWDELGNKLCDKEITLKTNCEEICPEIEFKAHADKNCCWYLEINLLEDLPSCHEDPYIKYEAYDSEGNLLSLDYTKQSGSFTDSRWCSEEEISFKLTYLDEVNDSQIEYCYFEEEFECEDCCDFDINMSYEEMLHMGGDIKVLIEGLECEFLVIDIYKSIYNSRDSLMFDTTVTNYGLLEETGEYGLRKLNETLEFELKSNIYNSTRDTKIKYRFVFKDSKGIACEKEIIFDFGEQKYGFGKESMIFEDEINFGISPNPSDYNTSINFISTHDERFQVLIYDLKARLINEIIYNAHVGPNKVNIDTHNLGNGTYNIMLKSENYLKTKRLIVSH